MCKWICIFNNEYHPSVITLILIDSDEECVRMREKGCASTVRILLNPFNFLRNAEQKDVEILTQTTHYFTENPIHTLHFSIFTFIFKSLRECFILTYTK